MAKPLFVAAVVSGLVFFLSLAGAAYYSAPGIKQQIEHTEIGGKNYHENYRAPRGFLSFLFPDAISIFTFWLMIATIALCITAAIQIILLQRAETVAEKSANAAKQSADTAQQSYVISERGYLGTKNWSAIVAEKGIVVGFQIENLGKSPIHILSAEYEFTINSSLPDTFMASGQVDIPGMLGAGDSQKATLFIDDIRAGQFASIREGKVAAYTRLTFHYRDVFKGIYRIIITSRYGLKMASSGDMTLDFTFPEAPIDRDYWDAPAEIFSGLRRFNYLERLN